MTADRIEIPRRHPRLSTALVAALTGLGIIFLSGGSASAGLPGEAGGPGANAARDEGQSAAGQKASHGDESAKKGPPARKDWYKELHHPPELPNAAYLLVGFSPDSVVGTYLAKTDNMFVVRPLYALLVLVILTWILGFMYQRRSLLPSRFQGAVELAVEGLDNLISGVLGKKFGRAYLPFLGALFIYIITLNLFGLLPFGLSPTSWICTTAALAICTFCVVQYTAFSKLGVKGVLMHWLGEPKDAVTWVVGIVMLLPLHIVEEFIKPLSLALRLFGNIFGEDVLLGSMLMLGIMIFSFLPAEVPIGLPLHLPFMFLATLTSTIQALVFTLLSTIYILMVLPHEDHGEHGEEAHAHA
ncbi:MAG: F0F1 ATP synthase subunit A [Polyangia bacterium]|jgi:F-type H+-transporting ATPase subunit a|nr:F0F1 ATP synthase subunit A [Polyangia bacterium]